MVYRICKLIKAFVKSSKSERGQVLPLVLIMLVLGATIVAGSLAYAATTVKTGATSKTNQIQLYSADAGVKDAIWRLKNNHNNIVDTLEIDGSVTYDPDESNDQDINNEDLSITIEYTEPYEGIGVGFWKITSIASSGGTATTVETYLFNYSLYFNFSAVARGEIRNKGTLVPENSYIEYWDYFIPVTLLRQYFSSGLVSSSDTTLNTGTTSDTVEKGNIRYTNGLSLSGKGTLSLTGNIYVDGYLDLGNEDFDIQLNDHTIYVAENEAVGTGWINAKAKTGLLGSGCIIAEGDIVIFPRMLVPGEYVLLMSVTGSVDLQPNSDFYGSVVAGGYDPALSISLTMQPGTYVDSTGDHSGLDFPLWAMSNWQSYRTAVVTGLLAKGEEDIAYSQQLAAIGKEPITWTLIGLPAWFSWDETSHTFGGTPPSGSANDYPITVDIEDAAGATASRVFTLTIVPQPYIYPEQWNDPTAEPYQLPSGKVGVYYAQDIGVRYGIRPFLWTATGLPSWATLDPVSGIIRGTPDSQVPCTFTVTVASREGMGIPDVDFGYDTKILTIVIEP